MTIVIGAIPTSGLTDNSPLLAKIVGMVIAALAALNYAAQRTALKRAYLAAVAGNGAPQTSKASRLVASALLVGAVATFAIAPISCGGSLNCNDPKNATNIGCVIENSVVDCTDVSSLPSAVAVVTPIISKLIVSATQVDGTINWPSIEQQIVDLALQYGMCVIAEVWNQLMNPGGGGSGSGGGSATLARRAASSADLVKEFERIRARVAPHRQFKTSGGTL